MVNHKPVSVVKFEKVIRLQNSFRWRTGFNSLLTKASGMWHPIFPRKSDNSGHVANFDIYRGSKRGQEEWFVLTGWSIYLGGWRIYFYISLPTMAANCWLLMQLPVTMMAYAWYEWKKQRCALGKGYLTIKYCSLKTVEVMILNYTAEGTGFNKSIIPTMFCSEE